MVAASFYYDCAHTPSHTADCLQTDVEKVVLWSAGSSHREINLDSGQHGRLGTLIVISEAPCKTSRTGASKCLSGDAKTNTRKRQQTLERFVACNFSENRDSIVAVDIRTFSSPTPVTKVI